MSTLYFLFLFLGAAAKCPPNPPMNIMPVSEVSEKKRRQKTIFTDAQRERMEEIFKETTKPDKRLKEQIAQELDLEIQIVSVSDYYTVTWSMYCCSFTSLTT